MPNVLAVVISSELATLHELDTVYSVEDVYVFLEIIATNNHNKRAYRKFYEKQQQ